mmetsp:Transcript_53132/g.166932  ORF Transcript_53132/g.166932 Transcript_53132/m.166932 type:complete len:333 (-) Transcript_53132:186-1184(-)
MAAPLRERVLLAAPAGPWARTYTAPPASPRPARHRRPVRHPPPALASAPALGPALAQQGSPGASGGGGAPRAVEAAQEALLLLETHLRHDGLVDDALPGWVRLALQDIPLGHDRPHHWQQTRKGRRHSHLRAHAHGVLALPEAAKVRCHHLDELPAARGLAVVAVRGDGVHLLDALGVHQFHHLAILQELVGEGPVLGPLDVREWPQLPGGPAVDVGEAEAVALAVRGEALVHPAELAAPRVEDVVRRQRYALALLLHHLLHHRLQVAGSVEVVVVEVGDDVAPGEVAAEVPLQAEGPPLPALAAPHLPAEPAAQPLRVSPRLAVQGVRRRP